jgi:hypothetical protein
VAFVLQPVTVLRPPGPTYAAVVSGNDALRDRNGNVVVILFSLAKEIA